jgi:hypothetical protein
MVYLLGGQLQSEAMSTLGVRRPVLVTLLV